MPAYFVYVCQKVLDRAKLETYWRKIVFTLEGYGARSLSSYAPFEQLEGEPVEAVVVVEFPSRERAREWYDSDAYKAIRHLRVESARYIGVLAEGGTPPIDQRSAKLTWPPPWCPRGPFRSHDAGQIRAAGRAPATAD